MRQSGRRTGSREKKVMGEAGEKKARMREGRRKSGGVFDLYVAGQALSMPPAAPYSTTPC